MGTEELLLENWRKLKPEKQQQVLELLEQIKSESETTSLESDFGSQTS